MESAQMELVDLETGGAADFEPAALQALFSVVSVRRALLRVQARVRGIRARELVRGMRMQRTLDSREIQEAALTMLDMRHVSSGTVLFEQGALADDGMCMIVRGTCDASARVRDWRRPQRRVHRRRVARLRRHPQPLPRWRC